MAISAIVGAVVDAVSAAAAAVGSVATGIGAFAAAGAEGLGIGAGVADAIGAGVGGAVVGGGLGALEAGVTGGNPLKGAEYGAITGGTLGFAGPEVQALTGLAPQAADALVGAAGGALGAKATGANPLTGALEGGASGFLAGSMAGRPTAGAPGGGATSAASAAAPASVTAPSPDLVSATDAASFGADSAVSANLPGTVGAGAAAGGGGTPGLDAGFGGAPQGGVTPAAPLSASPGPLQPNINTSPGPLSTGMNPPISSVTPLTAADSGVGALAPNINPNTAITAPATPTMAPAAGGLAGIGKALEKNPMLGIEGLAFGMDVLKGNQKPPFFNTLAADASRLEAQGAQMEGYLTSGTLPPGVQASLTAASESAAASIRSQYASRGMSGSSAEAQDLQNLQIRVQGQGAQIAQQLFQSGLSEVGMADQLYGNLMNLQIAQDQELSQSIGGLVSALALSTRPVQYVGG